MGPRDPCHQHRDRLDARVPAAVQAMKAGGNDVVNNAVRLHAQLTERWRLRSENQIIAGAISTGALKVVASYYDIDSGSVTILPD